MSPEFTRRPKTTKGAILLIRPNSKGTIRDSTNLAFVFQYNPETLTRTISSTNSEGVLNGKEEKHSLNSIDEQINLDLDFDTTDQLEHPEQEPDVTQNGLYPALAALESIIRSQSKTEAKNSPIVLFIWGSNRLIPVWINGYKITETVFDPSLNPIHARIELSMRVRELSEFKRGTTGYKICKNQENRRRAFTQIYSTKNQFELP